MSESKLRVIHFTPYFPPEGMGGVGEFVANLHRGLLEAGHESVVVTGGKNSEPGIHRIAAGGFGWFLKTVLWAPRASRFDIIHCQTGEALPLILALRMFRRRGKIIIRFPCSYKGNGRAYRSFTIGGRRFGRDTGAVRRQVSSFIHQMLDSAAIQFADGVNAITKASADDMWGGTHPKALDIIYNGVAPARPLSAGSAVPPCELFYAGSASNRKRVQVLPFVLERVRAEASDARLRIAGFRLEDHPELSALFEEKGLLDYVECIGAIPSADLPPYYQAASVALVPSAYEGLPHVILESMQNGTPVVATNLCGHPEAITDGVDGYLVELDNPAQMAERCVRLLKDPELASRMGEAARRTIAERFTLEREVREYIGHYRQLMGRSEDDDSPRIASEERLHP